MAAAGGGEAGAVGGGVTAVGALATPPGGGATSRGGSIGAGVVAAGDGVSGDGAEAVAGVDVAGAFGGVGGVLTAAVCPPGKRDNPRWLTSRTIRFSAGIPGGGNLEPTSP